MDDPSTDLHGATRPGATQPGVLIVAGPTCSGKSALALALAERCGGTVINADAMQVYRELRIVTARPTPEDEERAPHRLYGVRPCADPANAAWWREAAVSELAAARSRGSLPMLCGGTGLYLSALTQGLSDLPEISEPARAEARTRLAEFGPHGLHAALAHVDPATAARLNPNDSQRLARAWEVWRETGRGLVAWQAVRPAPVPWRFSMILLDPPRDALRAAIAARFAGMVAAGAVEEVRAVLDLHLDPALPAMRAHGVPELSAFLRGEVTMAEAQHLAGLATGQYTKRQRTWFRHRRIADPDRMHTIYARVSGLTQFSESEIGDLLNFVKSSG